MPRKGITENDVAEAMAALQAQDKPTSYRAIREYHGSGSLSTIANHVRELQRQRLIEAQPIDSDKPVLPDPVMKALYAGAEATWAELMDAADAVVGEHQATADKAITAAEAITQQAVEQRDTAEADNTTLTGDLKRVKRDFETLTNEHAGLRTAHAEQATQLATEATRADGLANVVAEKANAIAQLTADLATAERHTEERTTTLEDRLKRERERSARDGADWQSRLEKAEDRERRLSEALQASEAALSAERDARALLDDAHHALQHTADEHAGKIDALEHALAAESERLAASQDETAGLKQRVETLTAESASRAQDVAKLEQTVAGLGSTHAAAMDAKNDEIARLERLHAALLAKVPPSGE